MNTLAPQDRPREKLMRLGPASLGDNELLAVIISSGQAQVDAQEIANAVLHAAGGLHGLARVTRDELQAVKGIGTTKAVRVLAAIELGRRTLVREAATRLRFDTPRDLAAYLMPQYASRPVEQFGIVLLDIKHRLLRTVILSVGSLDKSVVDPREVFREATTGRAANLVIFHNHPSGDPTPSDDDRALTDRLVAAGELMEIPVIDHLILADNRYWSFKEELRLRRPRG